MFRNSFVSLTSLPRKHTSTLLLEFCRSKQGSSGGSDTKEDSGGWFAGLIDTIIGNIQLYISNVHVR